MQDVRGTCERPCGATQSRDAKATQKYAKHLPVTEFDFALIETNLEPSLR